MSLLPALPCRHVSSLSWGYTHMLPRRLLLLLLPMLLLLLLLLAMTIGAILSCNRIGMTKCERLPKYWQP